MHHAPSSETRIRRLTPHRRLENSPFRITNEPNQGWRRDLSPGEVPARWPQTADLGPRNRGYDSRDINAPRAFTRDTRPRKRLSMPRETPRRDLRERRPGTRPRHRVGPPRETSEHAIPCRKTAYARRKTRTPRPGGQGVHSEPVGAPVSRAPLEVGRAKRVSSRRVGFRCGERARYPFGAAETGFFAQTRMRRDAHAVAIDDRSKLPSSW